jgi:hypothetical protein
LIDRCGGTINETARCLSNTRIVVHATGRLVARESIAGVLQ